MQNLFHHLYAGRTAGDEVFRLDDAPARTAGEVLARIGRMAGALESLGVVAGDRVSFKLEKSEEVIILAHACLQLGAILHPLNTTYTDTEVGMLVGDAEPRLLITEPGERERLSGLAKVRVESLSGDGGGTLGAMAKIFIPLARIQEVAGDATAALLYTSGTTGKPKGACITHHNLLESARALGKVWKIGPGDRLLHALPTYHAHGLLTAVNSLLVPGGSIRFLSAFDIAKVFQALPETTIIMGVPTHYKRLADAPGLADVCGKLRLAISGSAPLPREIADRFRLASGVRIIERYGSTEAAIITAIPAGTEGRDGFVGFALPGVEIRTRAADGSTGALDSTGELETRGHNVFSGYWRNEAANATAFTEDGWFMTGDIASIDGDGCVQLLGRSKDLVISGGLNVYPKEVEDALDRALPGGESAVFGVPHPDFGEAVIAAVEGLSADIDEAATIRALRTGLAAYKVPKRILRVEALPRNRMGKVLKAELRQAHRDLFTDKQARK